MTTRISIEREDRASSAQTIIVAGGAGEVGEGIVAALVDRGASVLVPSRSAAKLAALEAALAHAGPGRVRTLHTDITTAPGIAALQAAAEAAGPLRGLVISLGGFWQGPPVAGVPAGAFAEALGPRLFTQLALVQSLLPLLRGPGTSLVQINGLAAILPLPGCSALHVSAAAQLALTRSLIADADAGSPTITSYLIEQWVRTRSRQDLPPDALTAQEVGVQVADSIDGATRGATTHAILRLGKSRGVVAVAPAEPAVAAAAATAARELLDIPLPPQ